MKIRKWAALLTALALALTLGAAANAYEEAIGDFAFGGNPRAISPIRTASAA